MALANFFSFYDLSVVLCVFILIAWHRTWINLITFVLLKQQTNQNNNVEKVDKIKGNKHEN